MIISALCPYQFLPLNCHSLGCFSRIKIPVYVHTAESPAWSQFNHQASIPPCPIRRTLPAHHKKAQTENCPLMFAISKFFQLYHCRTNQNKQLACHQCKTYHGKINEADLWFEHMANFGNARSCVYFKQKIALSVLKMCQLDASCSFVRSQQALSQLSNSHLFAFKLQMFC